MDLHQERVKLDIILQIIFICSSSIPIYSMSQFPFVRAPLQHPFYNFNLELSVECGMLAMGLFAAVILLVAILENGN